MNKKETWERILGTITIGSKVKVISISEIGLERCLGKVGIVTREGRGILKDRILYWETSGYKGERVLMYCIRIEGDSFLWFPSKDLKVIS